ncbi:hypothetical protein COS75_02215 [Candidatus Pacearchaeota archaeon CG06_land_8_20_14_3_00_35_12]|nr:MAG: hypothetical protein COS75_02215 [Candidatus Pacearchaeota archaeon CG06_land_8_20_14_3_00_35_12]
MGIASYEQFKKGDSVGGTCTAIFSAAAFGYFAVNNILMLNEKRKLIILLQKLKRFFLLQIKKQDLH